MSQQKMMRIFLAAATFGLLVVVVAIIGITVAVLPGDGGKKKSVVAVEANKKTPLDVKPVETKVVSQEPKKNPTPAEKAIAEVDNRPKFWGKWEQATNKENEINLWEFRSDGVAIAKWTDIVSEWSINENTLNLDFRGERYSFRFVFEASGQKLVLEPIKPTVIAGTTVMMKRMSKDRESQVVVQKSLAQTFADFNASMKNYEDDELQYRLQIIENSKMRD